MALTSINKNFEMNQNFWTINPQLKIMSPFNQLYNRDKTKDKSTSSKEMWVIFFLCDPDEEANKFATIPVKSRKEMLSKTFFEIDDNDEVIKECLKEYPNLCLSKLEKLFYEEQKSMEDRHNIIVNTSYTLDDTEKDSKGNTIFVAGKPMVKKGTATTLDKMRLDSLKIYQNYKEIEKIFLDEKNSSRVFGGREESAMERGLI
jgi:hypothetical protein